MSSYNFIAIDKIRKSGIEYLVIFDAKSWTTDEVQSTSEELKFLYEYGVSFENLEYNKGEFKYNNYTENTKVLTRDIIKGFFYALDSIYTKDKYFKFRCKTLKFKQVTEEDVLLYKMTCSAVVYYDEGDCYYIINKTTDECFIASTKKFILYVADELFANLFDSHLFVHLGNIDTKYLISMNRMFADSILYGVRLCDDFDTSHVTMLSRCFRSTELKKLDIDNINTSNVKNTVECFRFSALDKVDLRNWDLSNLISADFMFSNSTIDELIAVNYTTKKMKSIIGLFMCAIINEDTFRFDMNTELVEDASNLFSSVENKNLSIDLTSMDFSNITCIFDLFSKSTLRSVNMQEMNLDSLSGCTDMFASSKIGFVNMYNTNVKKYVLIERMFNRAKIGYLNMDNNIMDGMLMGNIGNKEEIFYKCNVGYAYLGLNAVREEIGIFLGTFGNVEEEEKQRYFFMKLGEPTVIYDKKLKKNTILTDKIDRNDVLSF